MVKKLFAIILTICMVITMLPQIAFMAVQYPQEVTVFDSAVSGFERQTFDYGNSDIGGNATINGNTVISNVNGSGFQFKANDKFSETVKNGAIITVSMGLVFGKAADAGQMLLTRYKDNDNAAETRSAILLEYYNDKALRAFSTNCYLKQDFSDASISGANINATYVINTKTKAANMSLEYTPANSEAKETYSGGIDLTTAGMGSGEKYKIMYENSLELIRCYLSEGSVLNSFKITLTDLSTNSLYASINTAESTDDVKEVFDYYLKNGTFSYGNRFDELSDSEKTVIYGRFINQNFTSDSEVQALFDKLVAKQFSIVTKTYTYDFEDSVSPFSNGSVQILSDGNKVFVPITGSCQLKPLNGSVLGNGPIVTEYDYHYEPESGKEGIYVRYLTDTSPWAYILSKISSSSTVVLTDSPKWTDKVLTSGTTYKLRQSLDVESGKQTTSVDSGNGFEKANVTIDGVQSDKVDVENKGNIIGLDLRRGANNDNTKEYIDNITIKVYNPVYTALSYTETADEVKNVFDTYKSIGALDVEDNLGEEVYSQFIGSSYTSTANLEAAIKVVAQFAALGRDVYVYDTHVKSGDTALDSEFEAGTITYGAKAYTDTAGTVVTLVIAQYKDKELTNLTYAEKTLAQGINDISDSLTVSESAGTTINVFAVDKNANPYVVHKLLTGK